MSQAQQSAASVSPEAIEHLTQSECWRLLRTSTIGRVAVIRDDIPDIFPVNHVVDHGAVVYRTHAGLLFKATLHHDVAFQSDGFDADTSQAWSVVLRGMATEKRHIDDILDSLALPLMPQQPGAKPRVVRITAREISGRRFTVIHGGDASHTHSEPEESHGPHI